MTELAKVNEQNTPTSVEGLLLAAVNQGATVDQLERLMELRRQMKAESAKAAYDQAMADFQRDCPEIQKSKSVDFASASGGRVKYNYAPLEVIVRQVKDTLATHGLSYKLDMEVSETLIKATCIAKHIDGHEESSSFAVPIDRGAKMSDAQKFASAQTFAKRYAFVNAFGIMTADDDDDNNSARPAPQRQQQRKVQMSSPKPNRPSGSYPKDDEIDDLSPPLDMDVRMGDDEDQGVHYDLDEAARLLNGDPRERIRIIAVYGTKKNPQTGEYEPMITKKGEPYRRFKFIRLDTGEECYGTRWNCDWTDAEIEGVPCWLVNLSERTDGRGNVQYTLEDLEACDD